MMRKSGVILSAGLLLTQWASAQTYQAPFTHLPGSIPLESIKQAAPDLQYHGRPLQPDEARDLAARHELKNAQGQPIGLDELDPDPTSTIWKTYPNSLHWRAQGAPQPVINDLEQLGLKEDGEELQFIAASPSPIERYYFTAQKITADGKLKIYQVFLDPKGHNILLRKALLRQLGYIVPPTDRLATVRIRFKNSLAKKNVGLDIGDKTFRKGEDALWIVNKDLNGSEDYLDLQDVIATEGPNDRILNLARGDMSPEVPQGRRLFDALLVPFNMTDAPESLNLLKWETGKVFNNQLILPHEDADAFANISYEDARWIMRKILKLNRSQWQQIFDQVKVPDEIKAVWMEKTIYNRNFLLGQLKFQNEFRPLDVNTNISMGARLQHGILKGERTWPGYARNWVGVIPTSPASKEQMMGLAKSVGVSNVIQNFAAWVNTYLPKTNLAKATADHFLDVQVLNFLDSAKAHKKLPIPRKFWSHNFYDIDFGLSRDIVSGTYMGTANERIEVADSIYFGAKAGKYFQKDGLPVKESWTGQADGWWVTSYTHLKPATTVDAYFKTPFRNIMIPYYMSKAEHPLQAITKLQPPSDKELSDDEKTALTAKIKEQMAAFNEQLGSKETVIVSHSWGPELDTAFAKALSGKTSVAMILKDTFTVMDRMQIYRKDENTVQVYFDPALFNVFEVGPAFQAQGYSFLKFTWEWTKGSASSSMFEFDITPDLTANPDFFHNIWAVSAALRGTGIKYFEGVQKNHWKAKHTFGEKGVNLDFLFWHLKTANSTDVIQMTDKKNKETDYVRRSQGLRTGIDYQKLVFDVATELAHKKFPNAYVKAATSGNPGDSYEGSSGGRNVVVEVEKAERTQSNPSGVRWDNIYGSVRYAWKGWDATRTQAEKIMHKINGMYGGDIFLKQSLSDTEKVQFYTIDVQLSFYREALNQIARMTDAQVDQLFQYYYRHETFDNQSQNVIPPPNGWAVAMKQDLRNLRRAIQTGDPKQLTESFADIIDIAENQLKFEAVLQMAGGIQNVFVNGSLRGFRLGAEDAEVPVPTLTLGQIGTTEPLGPLTTQVNNMGVAGGEGLISWLLSTLM